MSKLSVSIQEREKTERRERETERDRLFYLLTSRKFGSIVLYRLRGEVTLKRSDSSAEYVCTI